MLSLFHIMEGMGQKRRRGNPYKDRRTRSTLKTRKRKKLRAGRLVPLLFLGGLCLVSAVLLVRAVMNLYAKPLLEVTMNVSSLHLNDYDWSNVNTENTFWTYEDDSYTSVYGIDVSSHQGVIDWEAVKESGVSFAFIRTGYRGTESGLCTEDEMFRYNIEGALEQGIDVGVYFFSQAISVEEASEEAYFVIDQIRNYDVTLPVVFDMEYSAVGTNRIAGLSRYDKTSFAVQFMETVKEAGYTPMIYGSSYTLGEHYMLDYLQEYETWIADYDDNVKYPYHFRWWQYSEEGEVPGIDENCDLDIRLIQKGEQLEAAE